MTTPAPQPAMSLALSEVAVESSKTHRAQLAHRIGTYQAMHDEMLIDIALTKERGQPTTDAEAKAQELAARIQLLRQRLMQLLAEFHAGPSLETAPPAPKKPWERERFKKEVEELTDWLEWLTERCQKFSFPWVAAVLSALRSLPNSVMLLGGRHVSGLGVPNSPADCLDIVRYRIRHMQSLPWYLFCPANTLQDQIEKAQRLEHLCQVAGFELPAVLRESALVNLRAFAVNAEAQARAASAAAGDTMATQTATAVAHYESSDPALRLRAIQIIAGLSLPDGLRFDQNYTVRLMTDAQE